MKRIGLDMTIEDLGWTANSDSTETNEESLISPDIRELMGYCTSEISMMNIEGGYRFIDGITYLICSVIGKLVTLLEDQIG